MVSAPRSRRKPSPIAVSAYWPSPRATRSVYGGRIGTPGSGSSVNARTRVARPSGVTRKRPASSSRTRRSPAGSIATPTGRGVARPVAVRRSTRRATGSVGVSPQAGAARRSARSRERRGTRWGQQGACRQRRGARSQGCARQPRKVGIGDRGPSGICGARAGLGLPVVAVFAAAPTATTTAPTLVAPATTTTTTAAAATIIAAATRARCTGRTTRRTREATAAATTAAGRAEATTATTWARTTERAGRPRIALAGLVDAQRATVEIRAVEFLQRLLRELGRGHLDEGEAPRPAGLAIHDDRDARDLAPVRAEELAERLLVGVVVQVAHVELRAHGTRDLLRIAVRLGW
jgi:hypothetical protein